MKNFYLYLCWFVQVDVELYIPISIYRYLANHIREFSWIAEPQFQVKVNKCGLASEHYSALFSVVSGISIGLEAPTHKKPRFAEWQRQWLGTDLGYKAHVRIFRLRVIKQRDSQDKLLPRFRNLGHEASKRSGDEIVVIVCGVTEFS